MTIATPIRDQLALLREEEARIGRMPTEIEAERRALSADVEVARQDLRLYFAGVDNGGKTDDARKRKLTEAVHAAQAAVDAVQWDDRLSGAQLAGRRASLAVAEFITNNLEALALETTAIAESRRAAVVSALDNVREVAGEYLAAGALWRDIVEHAPGGAYEHRLPLSGRLDSAMTEVARALEQGLPVLAPPRILAAVAGRQAAA
jgi:hypothetical protein